MSKQAKSPAQGAKKWNSQEEEEEKTSIVLPSKTLNQRIVQAKDTHSCLVLLSGPSNIVGKQWTLSQKENSLGRSQNTTVFINDESLSRTHAKFFISEEENKVSIMDMDSTNKTFLNGKQIKPFTHQVLKNNDQIQMGNIILKFLEKGNIEIIASGDTFRRSITDPLTEIYNKRALISKGQEFFQKIKPPDLMSVIVFDVDHFKKINDTYGHSAGDYVLKTMTYIIKKQLIRGNDFFARWGGEEFCILAIRSPSEHVSQIAERIRKSIESYLFKYNQKSFPVTISIGVSIRKKEDQSWENLFNRADKALYQSKVGGRNKITVL